MNQKTSLFILAAGMGSRYGGLKQMEQFGPNGETIIDYSIYDAKLAGFDKFIFVIRPDMEQAFKEVFISKYQDKINISCVFQSIDKIPSWYKINPERTKPWGTAHALLMAKDVLQEPFLIINGDDFYGRESFELANKFLKNECTEKDYCIITYKLKNVLSENGTVKRGVCQVKNNYLETVEEIVDIAKDASGQITGKTLDSKELILKDDDQISMNMWGAHQSIFNSLDQKFEEFLKNNRDELKGEFFLPTVFADMIKKQEAQFKAIQTNNEWFGITYKEDVPAVKTKIAELINNGTYPKNLF